MNKRKKIIAIGLATALSFFCYQQIQKSHYKKTEGFSISNISSSLSFNSEWAIPALDLDDQRQLASALSQEYTYLNSGGQCFAFVSADKQYVIKFFKFNKTRKPFYADFPMPGPLKKKIDQKVKQRRDRFERDFTSYKLAFDELKDETGMIFAHLNKTKNLRQTLKITDKAGRKFAIDLDSKEFIVQKKTTLLQPQIKAYMENGQKQKAQQLLSNVVSLLARRSEKGIIDEDAKIHRNVGCMEEKALVIDIGRFRKTASIQERNAYAQDILVNSKRLLEWLDSNYPELKSSFEEEIHALQTHSN